VTSIDETNKLLALERARARLEAALATDADWQALAGSGPAGAATLETRLLSNPLFRAWKTVSAAIAAQQANGSANGVGGDAPPSSKLGAATEPEATVSFVERRAAPPRATAAAASWPAAQVIAALAAEGPDGEEVDAEEAEEAEVSVVRIEEHRHAGAVARLRRALHGEPQRG